MPARVDVPGVGPMFFPDEMSDDEIKSQVRSMMRGSEPREERGNTKPAHLGGAGLSPDTVFSYLQGSGMFQPHHTAGVIGNLYQESGLDPNAINPRSGAYGIGQWLGPRKKALFDYAIDQGVHPSDPKLQMDFLLHELQGSENKAYKQLLESGSPEAAAVAFSKGFERAGADESRDERRARIAQSVFNRFGGGQGGEGPAPAGALQFDPREVPLSQLFTTGAQRSAANLMSGVTDVLPSMVGRQFGFDEYAQQQEAERAQALQDIQENYPSYFPNLESVDDFRSGLGWLAERVGEQAPTIPAAIGPGLVGRIGAAALGRAAAGRSIAESAAQRGLTGEAAEALAQSPAAERLTEMAASRAGGAGLTAGLTAGSAAINIPETYEQIYKETGEFHPALATAFGTLKAGLDTVFNTRLLKQLSPAGKDLLTAKVAQETDLPISFKRALFAEATKNFAIEGGTEAAQDFIDSLAAQAAGSKESLLSKEHINSLLESGLVGGLVGTGVGAPGAALEASRIKAERAGAIEQRELNKEIAQQQEIDRQNAEQLRQQQEQQAAYQQATQMGPEAETKLLPPPRMGVTESGDVLGTAEQRAEYEARLAAAQSQQQRQRDLLGQQGITYPPGSDISQYAQQRGEPTQLDMFPAEKAAAEGAARRGVGPYVGALQDETVRRMPGAAELPHLREEKPYSIYPDQFKFKPDEGAAPASPILDANRIKATGLTPQSGFFKELVGKDLSKPKDLNAVKKIISKVQQNPILAQSTKDGVRNLFTQMLPEYGKQGEIFTPKGRVKKGVTGARPISRTIDTGVGAGPQIPSGPGGGVPTGGVGVPDESGVGVTQPLPPQAGAGEAREQPALAPDLQYPELPAVPAGGRNVLYGNKAELRKYIDTLRKALSEGRIDKQTHDSLRAKADNGLKELDDLNNSPEHKSASFANTLAEMNTNGKVVWNGGLIHLIQFTDSHGNIQYKATKGDNILSPTLEQMEPFDPNSKVTPEEAFQLYAARDAIEADEAAKHDKTPFVKFNKDGLAFSSNIPDSIRGVMTEWKNMLGLDVPLYVGFLSDAKRDADLFTGPHRTVGKLALIKKNARGFTKGMEDGSRMIILDQDKSLLANLEIMAHEMGHVFEKEVFKNADPQIKREIRDEYDKWYLANKGKTPKQFIKSLRARKVAKQSEAPDAGVAEHEMLNFHNYFSTFGEWFADQVSRWATTSDAPVSSVEKFFHRLGQAIKRFYAALTNQGYLPSAPVKKYLDGIAAQVKQENKNPPSDTDLRDFLGDMEVQEMSRDSGPESINEKIALPTNFEGVDGPFKAASGMGRVIKKIPFFNKEQSAAVAGTLDKLGKGWDSLYMSLLPGYALSDLASRYFPKGIAERYHKEIINHDGFIHTYATNVLEPITNIFRRAMDTNRKQQPIFNKMVDLSTKFQVDPTDKNSILNATKFSMGYITFDGEGNQVGREVKYFNTAAERDQAIKDHNKGKPREERAFRVTDPDVGVKTEAIRIKGMYDQLKPEWQLLYRTMKNANVKTYELLRNTLSERIDTHDLDPTAKIILKKDIFTRLAESGMINPYFALTREGDNWLSAEVPNKYGVYESVTTAFTDPLSREKFATDLKNVVYKFEREKGASHEDAMDTATQRVRSYSRIDEINYRDLPSSSAINSIFKIIDSKRPQQGANESAEDFRARMEQYDTIEKDIMQMVIKAMPETSILKSLHRRENTHGNSLDAMGSFERKQRSMVRQISNLKYRPRIRKSMEDMASYADMLGRGQDEVRDPETGEVVQRRVLPKDNDKQVRFLSAFRDHSKYVLNPTPSDLAGITKSAIFGGTMAFNPSSAIIELSNIPMIVYPYLGAEYGMSTSRKALQNAHKLFKRSGNSRMMTPYGSENESDIKAEKLRSGWSVGNYDKDSKEGKHYAPLVELMASTGMLNRSQLYENLLTSSRTSLMDKWNAAAGWMLHTTSRHNREVAAMATYDLELAKLKKRGVPDAQARELAASKAINVTEMTNGSVASADAPRFAHNWIGSIVLMYKRFGIANMYMQMKMVREAYMNPPERLPHESAEEYQAKVKQFRQEAEVMKKRFARLQLTTALFSGIHGLPMYGAAAFLYNMFKDDDEDDADTVVRKGIGDMFFNGPLEYYSGISLASRMGLSGLIFKEPRSSGDTSSFSQMMVDSLGGPLPGMVDKIENGINMIQNGNVERGIEAIAPAFLANLMKGTRYMVTGKAETLRGDPIYDDINPLSGAIQILGFAPAEVQKRQEFNAKQMGLAKSEAAKDSNLKGRYYKAYREHDYVGMREAREALLEFGKKHPHLKYTPGTVDGVLRKSVKRHDQATKDMIMGKSYSAKRRPVVLEAMDDLDIEE